MISLFHGTDVEFDHFDIAHMASKGATNGHLGVWAATYQEGAETFGNIIVHFTIPEMKPFFLSSSELLEMHKETKHMPDGGEGMYKDFSRNLIEQGYTIIAIEKHLGSEQTPDQDYDMDAIGQVIVLDVSSIQILEHIPSQAHQQSTWGM